MSGRTTGRASPELDRNGDPILDWMRKAPSTSPRITAPAGHVVPYAELHCHSDFSFLDGVSDPEELIEEAVRLGLEAIAITDHDGFYAASRFAEAALAYDLRTIYGAELSLGLTTPQNGVADPEGSAMFSWYSGGELASRGNSITEGIGQGRVTANLQGFTPDFACQIPDDEALPILFDLLEHEGLCLGGSSGINVAGAMRMARDMGPGKTIITVLCDSGTRYLTKLWNPAFLRDKGLPVPHWLERGASTLPDVTEN